MKKKGIVKVEPNDWILEWRENREETALKGDYKAFAEFTEAIIDAEHQQRTIDQRKVDTQATCKVVGEISEAVHPGVEISAPKGQEVDYTEKLQMYFSNSLSITINKDRNAHKKANPEAYAIHQQMQTLNKIDNEKTHIRTFLNTYVEFYEQLLNGALSEVKLDRINFETQNVGTAKTKARQENIIDEYETSSIGKIPELKQLKKELSKKTEKTNKMVGVLDRARNQADLQILLKTADLVTKQLEEIEPEKLLLSSSEKRKIQQDIDRLMILTVAKRLTDAKEILKTAEDNFDFVAANAKNQKLEVQLNKIKEIYSGPDEDFSHVSSKDVQDAEEKVRQRSYKLLDLSDHEKRVDDIVLEKISGKSSHKKEKKALADSITTTVKSSCLDSIKVATDALEKMRALRSTYEDTDSPEILKETNEEALSLCSKIEKKLQTAIDALNKIYTETDTNTNKYLTSSEKPLIMGDSSIKKQIDKEKGFIHGQALNLTAAHRNLSEHYDTLSRTAESILNKQFEPGTLIKASKAAWQYFLDKSRELIDNAIIDKKLRGNELDSKLQRLEKLKDKIEDNAAQFIDTLDSKNPDVTELLKTYNQVVGVIIDKFSRGKYKEKELDECKETFLMWKDDIEKSGKITSKKDTRLLKDIIKFLQNQGVEANKDVEHYRSAYYMLNFLAQSDLLDEREASVVKTKLAVLDVLKEQTPPPFWLSTLVKQTNPVDIDRLMLEINKDASIEEKFEKDMLGHWNVYVAPVKEEIVEEVIPEIMEEVKENRAALHKLCARTDEDDPKKGQKLATLSQLINDDKSLLYEEDENYYLPIHVAAQNNNPDAMTIILNCFDTEEEVLEHLKLRVQISTARSQKGLPPYDAIFLAARYNSDNVLNFLVNIFNREDVNSFEFLELFDNKTIPHNDFLKPRVDLVRLFNYVIKTGNKKETSHFLKLIEELYKNYNEPNAPHYLSETIKSHFKSAPRHWREWSPNIFKNYRAPPYLKHLKMLMDNKSIELPKAVGFLKDFTSKHSFSPEKQIEPAKTPPVNPG